MKLKVFTNFFTILLLLIIYLFLLLCLNILFYHFHRHIFHYFYIFASLIFPQIFASLFILIFMLYYFFHIQIRHIQMLKILKTALTLSTIPNWTGSQTAKIINESYYIHLFYQLLILLFFI